MTSQLAFVDPAHRYPPISPPKQHQDAPGSDDDLDPAPDLGVDSYVGTGRLRGRRALITGGDSGIGAAVAIAFAREGADVALSYLPEEHDDAERIAQVIEAEGRTAVRIARDLTDSGDCSATVRDAADGLGGLDILVNNAGTQTFRERLEDLPDDQFETTLRTNVSVPFWLTRAALEYLEPGSTVINTTSLEAYSPAPILVDYATSKAAINGFTKALAQQLAPRGIRVNAVAPGATWTPLQVSGGQPQEKIPHFGGNAPLGRAAQPTELAPAYVFLASSESSYVLGETLNVNGGRPTP